MKKVIISVTNDIVNDQRVLRTAATLGKNGWEVVLVGRHNQDGLPHFWIPHKMIRFRMLFKKGPLFYAFFNIRLCLYLLLNSCHLLWANDLDTLLANFLASRWSNRPMVYDSHEYFTEVPELVERKKTQWVWKRIEGIIFPRIKYVITISDSIAQSYENRYGVPVLVVRNFTHPFVVEDKETEVFRFGGKKIILYQGTLNRNRGLEPMIRSMSYIPNAELVIVGNGPEKASLVELIRNLELDHRIFLIPKMLPYRLQQLTPMADLGLSIEEDIGLNYQYALPNKLFDYIYARVPVLVSSLPEMRYIVQQYGIGWVLESHEPTKIAAQVNRILSDLDREKYTMKKNLEKAAMEMNWEQEEKKLLAFVDSIYLKS